MSLQGDQDGGRLGELLGLWVEQRLVHGVDVAPEALCRDDPPLLGPLRDCIRQYELIDRLLAPPQDLAGRDLLHYRIGAELGTGGMGRVYAAEDTKLGRRVAVKVLPPDMAADRERLERFRREARIVAALNHPNIVTLFSVEEAGGVRFLTMELVEGETLGESIPPDGLEQESIVDFAGQLADALAAAHERGVVHRDLKPANVMAAADGKLKILDFGLAKLRAPESDERRDSTLTMEGKVLGTVPYMAPEQVLGETVDPRTDLFSLGVILYEMATGRRPFRGGSNAELISSILRDAPEPITGLRSDLDPALERVAMRLLEKEPQRRFQTAIEVRDELRRLQAGSQAQTEAVPAAAAAARRTPGRRGAAVASGAVFVALLSIGWGWRTYVDSARPAARTEPSRAAGRSADGALDRTSLAVLHFRNLTGDPELDWLSNGIADMLMMDLAQSPELDVLSSSRLHQVLKDLELLGQTAIRLELIQEVGARSGVETVVRGSYARAGDAFRIALTIETAADGTTLATKRVEGRGEESLFPMIDELSAAVRNRFEVERPAASPASVEAVTTSSLEAWRCYSEGMALYYESKRPEAVVLLEKAVEIDPDFALALADLGTMHANLAHAAEAASYMRRAFELADRLPSGLSHRVRATYYGARWATTGLAIEAYRESLRFDPGEEAWRNNLARRYAFFERYEEAVEEWKRLIAGGTSFGATYFDAANAHAALTRFETGYRILSDFAARHPERWNVEQYLGWYFTEWGRLEEALSHLRRAAELRSVHWVHYGLWRVQVLREDWEQAELEAEKIRSFDDSFARWRGAVSNARNALYAGRSEEALSWLDEAAGAYAEPGAFAALARCWKAELLLERGEPARALAEAEEAREEGREEWPELFALFVAARAQQELGRPAAADALAGILRERWKRQPNAVEERQLHHLAGRLALARGDTEAAVEALTRAASSLPPKGVEFAWHVFPDHVPIWFALGEAELAAGRDADALGWFERVAASGSEHLERPLPYVRSFYVLGRLRQRRGEAAAARRGFERFLRFWDGGDLDRERTAAAHLALQGAYPEPEPVPAPEPPG